MTENSNVGTLLKRNWLFIAGIGLSIFLLFRNTGVYPVVFADEYYYSKFSRLLPIKYSIYPDYLYLAIYRLTNICGDGFLNCARTLNVLFFVAAMPFIYLTTRRVSSRQIASLVALLAVLRPVNSYTAWYMPEALYFFSFWLLTWFILRLDNSFDLRSWCVAGILLGLTALVKPHALFLLPAVAIYILYVSRKQAGKWVLQAIRNANICVASAFAAKFSIGYLLDSSTAWYMPEALYFFSFWLLAWFIMRLDNSFALRSWCVAGILLGLTALVKPYALFLLPAVAIYILYVSRKQAGKWVLQAIRNTIICAASAFAAKFSIGYLLAGKAGATIFGPMYNSIVSQTISNSDRYFELLWLSTKWAKSHIVVICLMFGMPIAFAIKASFDSILSKEETRSGHRIAVYALLVLVDLVLVVSVLTASFGKTVRLHMRYYDFALPLLLVIAAYQLSLEQTTNMLKRRAIIAFPIGAAIVYAVYTLLAPYPKTIVDCPELYGFTRHSIVFYVLSSISFFALALWVYSARAGAKIFLYLLMPLAVCFSTYSVNRVFQVERRAPGVFVKAGIITKQYLSHDELSKLVIVGSNTYGLFQSLFYLDNPTASFETIPPGGTYDLSKLPVGKEWILAFGDHSLPENMCYEFSKDGFTLAHAIYTGTVDFSRSSWPCSISTTQGLSFAEPSGTWSSGDVVTLEFSKPLPEKFILHLYASAFGPNVGKEFAAHAGDSAIRFTLAASPEERVLEFSNLKRSKIIKIDVPSPCSPKELGLRPDDRRLGILLRALRIEPL